MWMSGCDVEMKAQSSQLKFSEEWRHKKACQVESNVEVLFIFFNYNATFITNFCHQVIKSTRNASRSFMQLELDNLEKTTQETDHRFCTTTHWCTLHYVSDSSWRNITHFHATTSILWTCLPVTFFYFPYLKGHSKVSIFQ